jgi:hypothetical protein
MAGLSLRGRAGIDVGEEAVARAENVVPGQAFGEGGVAGHNGVEDVLVLRGNGGRGEQARGIHLPDAQLDLPHEECVHAREARARLALDEAAVEGDVVTGERLTVHGAGDEGAVRVESGAGDRAPGREGGEGGTLDDGAVVEQVDDIGAAQLGNPGGVVRFAAQYPIGDEAVDRDAGGGAGDAEAQRDGGFRDGGARGIGLGDDARTQHLGDGAGQHRDGFDGHGTPFDTAWIV